MKTNIEKEIKSYRIVALLLARAGGSKPYRCFWKLCGKTLLQWGIEIARNSKYIDDVVVATEDSRIKEAAEKCGAKVVVRPYFQAGKFPLDLAASPFNRQKSRSLVHVNEDVYLDSVVYSMAFISDVFGIVPEILVSSPIQVPLFKTESMDRMIEKFFEDEEAWQVFAIYPTTPKLWTINPKINRLFPVFYDSIQILDRQSYPTLYRSTGFGVIGCGRYMTSEGERRRGHIVVKPEEGLAVHDEEDLALAEFYMKRRLEKEGK